MKAERLNGTVYEVHSFVVALPCGHIDTLEVRVREADPDKEDYIADCIAATEAGKNAALPVCRRCLPGYCPPHTEPHWSFPPIIVTWNRRTGAVSHTVNGRPFVPSIPNPSKGRP